MRKSEAKNKGFKPDSKGEPYDWNAKPEYAQTKIASSETSVKTAFNLSHLKKKVMAN
jgi:hypothetical protein